MNEVLRRALAEVGMDEIGVATNLSVDPKTVRRWFEGRLPRPRYRQALAALTGVDELAIWPDLREARTAPLEVTQIYPHESDAPGALWASILASALSRVDVLDVPESNVLRKPPNIEELRACALRGVSVRLLIGGEGEATSPASEPAPRLGVPDGVQVRLYASASYHVMLRADEQMLVHHFAQGVAYERTPLVHLTKAGEGRMYASYLEGFEQIWRHAEPVAGTDEA